MVITSAWNTCSQIVNRAYTCSWSLWHWHMSMMCLLHWQCDLCRTSIFDTNTCSWHLSFTPTHVGDMLITWTEWHVRGHSLWHWHIFMTSMTHVFMTSVHDTCTSFMTVVYDTDTCSGPLSMLMTLTCSCLWHCHLFMICLLHWNVHDLGDTSACLWPQSMTPLHVYDLSLWHHHMFMTSVWDTITCLWPQSMTPLHDYDLSLCHHHMLTTSVYDHGMLMTSVYETFTC